MREVGVIRAGICRRVLLVPIWISGACASASCTVTTAPVPEVTYCENTSEKVTVQVMICGL